MNTVLKETFHQLAKTVGLCPDKKLNASDPADIQTALFASLQDWGKCKVKKKDPEKAVTSLSVWLDNWKALPDAVKKEHPVVDKNGNNLYHMAAYLGLPYAARIINYVTPEIADIKGRNYYSRTGRTPLEFAEMFGQKDVIDVLKDIAKPIHSYTAVKSIGQDAPKAPLP
ncbi:MAG TPA: hypothetical protein VFS88_00010 [Micavibrio sp.]|nr:hypothetical protein [Micavibrio sp.]